MRHAILLSTLVCALISCNCGSSADPALVRQRIALVKAWHLVYSSRLDPNGPRPLQETSTLRSAQVDRNLRLVDLTSEVLKQKYGVPVTEDTTAVCGQIRLTSTESLSGQPIYIDIALYDSNDQLITRTRAFVDTQARIEISQSDARRDPHSFNQSYAAYVAERIVYLLLAKQASTP